MTAQAQYANYDYDKDTTAVLKQAKTEKQIYVEKYTPLGGYSYSKLNLYDNLVDFSNTYLFNPVPFEEELTFDKLMEIIRTKQLKSIEAVIAELPEYMRNHNYIVMYRSRSLQNATPKFPRVIVYTPTASFIVTFNGGEAGQRGGNSLEMIQFHRAEARFEFRELNFNGVDVPTPSEANPKKCLECHQSPSRKDIDPRPNWEPYNTWIGAFGSDNGTLKNVSLRESLKSDHRVILPQDDEALEEQTHEFEFFKEYIDIIAPVHPRYKYLGQFSLKAPTSLTEHLGLNNAYRVARLMSQEKAIYSVYKEFFNAKLRCITTPGLFVSTNEAMAWHWSFEYPEYYTYTTEEYEKAPFATVHNMLTNIYQPLGVDTSDWSMDFGSGGRMAFRSRFGMPAFDRQAIRQGLNKMTPDGSAIDAMECKNLYDIAEPKVNEAWKKNFQLETRESNYRPPATGADIVQRCIQCHTNKPEVYTPELPFDNLAQLQSLFFTKALTSPRMLLDEIVYRTSEMATQEKQMPPGRRLSPNERRALVEYLETAK